MNLLATLLIISCFGCTVKNNTPIQVDQEIEIQDSKQDIGKNEEEVEIPVVYKGNTTYNPGQPEFLFNIQALTSVNIRNSFSTSAMKISLVDPGDKLHVYDEINNEGYSWYKISCYGDAWVANDGTFFAIIDKTENIDVPSIGHLFLSSKLEEVNYYYYEDGVYDCSENYTYLFDGDVIVQTIERYIHNKKEEIKEGFNNIGTGCFYCYKDIRYVNKCDSEGRLVSVMWQDGREERYEYDEKGRLATYHNHAFLSTDKFYFYYNNLDQLVYNERFHDVY